MECVSADIVPNCEFYTPNFLIKHNPPDINSDYVCTKCKPGYYALFNNPLGKAHINDNFDTSSDFKNRMIPIQNCLAEDDVESTLFVTNETLENCEIIMQDNSAEYAI